MNKCLDLIVSNKDLIFVDKQIWLSALVRFYVH